MNRSNFTVILLGLIALFAGCAGQPELTSEPSELPNDSPSVEGTSEAPFQFTQRCVHHQKMPPPPLMGAWLLENQDLNNALINLVTGERQSAGRQGSRALSPDGSLLAYRDVDLGEVVVINAEGEPISNIPDPDEHLFPVGWGERSVLLLEKRRAEFGELFPLRTVVALDLETMSEQEWVPEDYPDLDAVTYPWNSLSYLILNPDLRSVIYPTSEGVVLWDIQESRELARIFPTVVDDNMPRWSPDGRHFSISAPPVINDADGKVIIRNSQDDLPYVDGTDIFLVEENGAIRRLTYFTTTSPSWQFLQEWSPDGNSIAFLLNIGEYEAYSGELAVVDVETGDVTLYCIGDGFPIWSPDSNYLIFNNQLIDVQASQAWDIGEFFGEDLTVIGWMASSRE